ncbi:endonuclease/exonuclease/phosphatase family protein [Nitzschia inconspicua]|uniref:Endonuclease/exonuclease/phosphatase family protein n=1 Tax=Nitzschia inconspicua TaxID=303405 RepID=A0A9K3PM83_9STRA|nr:endonuclease/exonuclease/phosphatase family protein [Nitzschia inconspicua]
MALNGQCSFKSIKFLSHLVATLPLVSGLAAIRLTSWNILAQDYVQCSKYPWIISPEFLNWEHRRERIVHQLLDGEHLKPDVVCLQEVQVDLFPDLMLSLSSTFDGILQNVTETHNVATAILIRKDGPFRIKRAESRSRALISVLQDKSDSNSLLYLSTVHLDADKAWDRQTREYHQRQRENQLKSLLKRLNNQCHLDNKDLKDVPVVIAGDFNVLRNNPINTALAKGELLPQLPIHLHDVYLEAEANYRPSRPTYPGHKYDNLGIHDLVKTYRGGAVLDYIYVSDQVQVVDTLLCHPSSHKVGQEKWPCQDHPSDHLPVGIDFKWP